MSSASRWKPCQHSSNSTVTTGKLRLSTRCAAPMAETICGCPCSFRTGFGGSSTAISWSWHLTFNAYCFFVWNLCTHQVWSLCGCQSATLAHKVGIHCIQHIAVVTFAWREKIGETKIVMRTAENAVGGAEIAERAATRIKGVKAGRTKTAAWATIRRTKVATWAAMGRTAQAEGVRGEKMERRNSL